MTKIGALGTTQAATSNRRTLRRRATRRNNREDTKVIIDAQNCESYTNEALSALKQYPMKE
jgi:hypothetical protein